MKNLIAYHGDTAVKTKYLNRVIAHRKADEIQHGYYWENGKGCAVGCTIEGSQHSRYETELGIPEAIAYLEDRIFEGLPNGEAKLFPEQFLKAIKPGADLSLVTPRFMIWLMKDLEQYAEGYPDALKVLRTVANLYRRIIKGEIVTNEEWNEAARAAWAAEAAARAAAEAAAEAAEAAGAAGAAWAAAGAAWAAEAAEAARAAEAAEAARAAEAAAEAAAYQKMAKKLLSLLKAAPINPRKE